MGRRLLASLAITGLLAVAPLAAFELPALKQPSWQELSPQQKDVLEPLAADWDQMESFRRKKWVGIAARYPYMSAEEQSRIQRQMREWAKLTPQERKAAREKYKSLRQAPPEQRANVKQKWQEYSELPDEEKKRLQAAAAAKKPVATQPKPVVRSKQPPLSPAAVLTSPNLKPVLPNIPAQQAPAPVFTATPMPAPTASEP